MNSDLNAIYEGGAFWPVSGQKVAVPEGETVKITVEPPPPPQPFDVLSLAANVYAGLSPDDITEVEQIALDRSNFFRERFSESR